MDFKETSMKTIFMAKLRQEITVYIGKLAIIAVMANLDKAMNMVFLGVSWNFRKNADQ
jgi:hypothetical protein